MVSALFSINEVYLRRVRLIFRWVTVSGVQSPVPENLSQYVISHPGQLSLAIPPWVGVMSTSQRAVMPCGWGVKAGMVHEWVAGKTVWFPRYHGPYLSALAMGSSHNRALCKCPITYRYLLLLYYMNFAKIHKLVCEISCLQKLITHKHNRAAQLATITRSANCITACYKRCLWCKLICK